MHSSQPQARRGPGKGDGRRTAAPAPWHYVLNRGAAQLIPLSLAYRVSVAIADAFYGLWTSKRETALHNYARILGRPLDDPLVGRTARSCFRQFGRYIVELGHVQGWDTDSVMERLEMEGEEHFDEAEAHGRGVIFVSAHMGSIEVASSLVVLRGYKITSVAEDLRPRLLMDWIRTCRAKMGITLLPATGSGIRLLRALRRKEMVAFVVDIGVERVEGVPITFFGRQTVFPVGPARLARLSGAPIVFGLAARQPGGGFRAHIQPPLLSDRRLDAEEDARQLTQRIAEIFERFVRRYPDQWYAFRDMWPDRT